MYFACGIRILTDRGQTGKSCLLKMTTTIYPILQVFLRIKMMMKPSFFSSRGGRVYDSSNLGGPVSMEEVIIYDF